MGTCNERQIRYGLASFVESVCKQHIKMASQTIVAHSSAKNGNKWRKNKNSPKEKNIPQLPPPKAYKIIVLVESVENPGQSSAL